MGLLQQNLAKYTHIYEQNHDYITDAMLVNWFGKSAVKRTELEDMSFTKRSAVVIVGVSGSGKTHFAREFVKTHPNFILCSHDECFAKARIELSGKRTEYELDNRMNENLEKMIRSAAKRNNNVIFDGLFVNLVVRAALLNTLRTMGFEIHVVYITLNTLISNIKLYASLKAIQTQAHRLYSIKHKTDLSAQQIVTNRHKAIELYAEDNNLSVEEAAIQLSNTPEVVRLAKEGLENSIYEIECHLVQQQELNQAFMLGADYYYEL